MPEAFTTRTLRELTRVVFSNLVGMILIVVLLTGGTYVACKKADPIYESSVTILVKQPKRASSKVEEVSPDRSLEVFLKTQRELILSDRVLSRTLALLGDSSLQQQWRTVRDALQASEPKQRDQETERLEQVIARIDTAADEIVSKRQQDLHRFRDNVQMETPGGQEVAMSEVFSIVVRQKDTAGFKPGQRAQMAADILTACYIDRYQQVQAEGFRDAAGFVQTRLDDLKEKTLNPSQAALGKFLTEKLGGGVPAETTPTTQAVRVLNPADIVILEQLLKSGTEAGAQVVRRRFEEEKIRLRTELAHLQSLQQQLDKELDDERISKALTKKRIEQLEQRAMDLCKPSPEGKKDATRQEELKSIAQELYETTDQPRIIVPQEVLTNNDIVNKMKKKLADLIIDRNKMRGQFAPTYRELIDLYIEIARAKLEIIEELRAERRALAVQVETTKAQLDQVAEQITRLTVKLDALARLLPEYDQLQAQLRTTRINYATMETELLQAQADEERARKEITIQVVDPASIPDPDRPAVPWTPVYTLVGLVVSLLLAFAYAFLADHFDHTLRSIHEVERYLGTQVLGSVSKTGRRIVV